MSLSGAAAAMGLPESLVQRSAEARAAETGASIDEILTAWAGGEAAPPSSGDAGVTDEPPAQPSHEATPGSEEEAEPDMPEISVETAISAPSETPVAAAMAPSRAPLPVEVTAAEASNLPEVVTVPTAGIRERTNFVIPRWLTAVMLIAPLFALFALGGAATGACGEGTELDTNVITGEIVNCDGSEFTGSGAGGGGTDFIALGQSIYDGSAIAGVNCAGCHGAGGAGTAAGPALASILTTFGSCDDHDEWVSLGTQGFQSAGRDTYGDTAKPVGGFGQMPGFASSLTAEQIAAVAAFERTRFGGADNDGALVDCGLAEPEGSEGEAPADGGDPGEGGTPPGEDATDAASG